MNGFNDFFTGNMRNEMFPMYNQMYMYPMMNMQYMTNNCMQNNGMIRMKPVNLKELLE